MHYTVIFIDASRFIKYTKKVHGVAELIRNGRSEEQQRANFERVIGPVPVLVSISSNVMRGIARFGNGQGVGVYFIKLIEAGFCSLGP